MRVALDRNRGGSYLVVLIAGAGIYSMLYFVTYFEQQVMRFDAIKTGFSLLPRPQAVVHQHAIASCSWSCLRSASSA